MSLTNDYTVQLLAVQKSIELRAEADNDRLARIALAGRQPWWRRLFQRTDRPATGGSANGLRSRRSGPRRPQIGAHHMAR